MLNLFKSKKNLDLAIVIGSTYENKVGLNGYPNRYLMPFTPRFRTIDFAIASLSSIGLKKIIVLTSEDKETLTNYLITSWPKQNFVVFDRIDLEHEFINFFYDYTSQNPVELISIIRGDLPVWFDMNSLKTQLQREKIVILKYKIENQTFIPTMILEKQLFSQRFLNSLVKDPENFSLSNLEKELHAPSIPMQGFIKTLKSFKEYVEFHIDLLDNYLILDHLNSLIPVCPNSPIAGMGLIEKEGHVINSLIGDNTQIKGRVENSVIFPEVKIEKGCHIKDSIILPGNFIGKNTLLTKTLIQEYFYETILPNIGQNSVIGSEKATIPNEDFPNDLNFGYTLIGQNAEISPNSKIGSNACLASNSKLLSKKQALVLNDGQSAL